MKTIQTKATIAVLTVMSTVFSLAWWEKQTDRWKAKAQTGQQTIEIILIVILVIAVVAIAAAVITNKVKEDSGKI